MGGSNPVFATRLVPSASEFDAKTLQNLMKVGKPTTKLIPAEFDPTKLMSLGIWLPPVGGGPFGGGIVPA